MNPASDLCASRKSERPWRVSASRVVWSVSVRIIFLLLLTVGVRPAVSQTTLFSENVPGDTVVTAVIPAAAFASDIGLVGALAINRFRYHPRYSPFRSLTEIRLQASTKAYLELRVTYEQTGTPDNPLRSRWSVHAEHHPYDYFFGLGNTTEFDQDLWDERYYFYEVLRFGLSWRGRYPVFRPRNSGGKLDLTGLAAIRYEQPAQNQENLISDQSPEGFAGGWSNRIGLGLLWENRDSEFAATRGNRVEISGEWAPVFLFSDYPMALIEADIRQFFTVPFPWLRPVLALRLAGSHAFGTLPYWDMPYLGDERTLRGYPLYRFRGDAAAYYNVELRTWLYEHIYWNFKFGIHGFHDAGRVFTRTDSFRDILSSHNRTVGGGIAMTLFTPDLIVRLDAGFSDEMMRLYMNIGYMF